MIKLDLHTHSLLSHDGGISMEEYKKALSTGRLDCIAITDHNEIDFALAAHKKFGKAIIVGEEIKTTEGEIIGLFLSERIERGLSVVDTIRAIKEQKGLVSIPHPTDMRRSAVSWDTIQHILPDIDIFETFNARMFQLGYEERLRKFAEKHSLSQTAVSDSHSYAELGSTYVSIPEFPTRVNLGELVRSSQQTSSRVSMFNFLSPTRNRLQKYMMKAW